MSDNTQILLRERPKGKLEESHFEIRQAAMPVPMPPVPIKATFDFDAMSFMMIYNAK